MKKDFSYLWYPLTSFVEKDKKDINFTVPDVISPYLELNTESITYLRDELEKSGLINIEINPFIRFNKIFQLILHPEYEIRGEDKLLRMALTNILLHLLGELDLYFGQNRKDIIVKQMKADIENNSLGKEMAEMFGKFKDYEKHILVDILYNTYCHLDMLEAFKKAVKMIFKDSIIYDNLSSATNLIIYVNMPGNEENQTKIEFIKRLFLPISLDLDLFWEYHFGVIGVDITMRIGEIAIF